MFPYWQNSFDPVPWQDFEPVPVIICPGKMRGHLSLCPVGRPSWNWTTYPLIYAWNVFKLCPRSSQRSQCRFYRPVSRQHLCQVSSQVFSSLPFPVSFRTAYSLENFFVKSQGSLLNFLTAILYRGPWNYFFFRPFTFHIIILFGLLYPLSICTFISFFLSIWIFFHFNFISISFQFQFNFNFSSISVQFQLFFNSFFLFYRGHILDFF